MPFRKIESTNEIDVNQIQRLREQTRRNQEMVKNVKENVNEMLGMPPQAEEKIEDKSNIIAKQVNLAIETSNTEVLLDVQDFVYHLQSTYGFDIIKSFKLEKNGL